MTLDERIDAIGSFLGSMLLVVSEAYGITLELVVNDENGEHMWWRCVPVIRLGRLTVMDQVPKVFIPFFSLVFCGAKGAGLQKFLHSAVFRLFRSEKCPNPDIFYRGAGTKIFRNQEFRKFRPCI